MVAHKRYDIGSKSLTTKMAKKMVEKLGIPDYDQLSDDDHKLGVSLRYQWIIKDANISMICSIIEVEGFGPTFVRDISNLKKMEEMKKRVKK